MITREPPAEDLDRLMAVMDVAFNPAFGEAWTRRQVYDVLTMGSARYDLVAAHGGRPVEGEPASGFTLSRRMADAAELLLIAVRPISRGTGLGKSLIKALIDDCRNNDVHRIFLEMRRGNPAEYLYAATGFVPVGMRPAYYKDGKGGRIDAITFARTI